MMTLYFLSGRRGGKRLAFATWCVIAWLCDERMAKAGAT